MNTTPISKFVRDVKKIHTTFSNVTEHTYRSTIEELLNSFEQVTFALNEPKKRTDIGAPDFAIYGGEKIIGHIEAKKPSIRLDELDADGLDQKDRYLSGFNNLIYTNCIDWELYQNGEIVQRVNIAEFSKNDISGKNDRYSELVELLEFFLNFEPQNMNNINDLARWMAGKTRLIKYAIFKALTGRNNKKLHGQYMLFKEKLIDGLLEKDFANIYAETIAYGLFSARIYTKGKKKLDRHNAYSFIPKSNPFLREFFSVAYMQLPQEILLIIDDLISILNDCDIKNVLTAKFGITSGKKSDPLIYFYELFIDFYDPERKSKYGVYYTPQQVVKFMVGAVDEILSTEFGLREGLAYTDEKVSNESQKVQILDPAAGTGTFLVEIVSRIEKYIRVQSNPTHIPDYIEKLLIPRLHGFEIMMAPYAMCHLMLERMFEKMGYNPSEGSERISVFLTDSLDNGESEEDEKRLAFLDWLSDEAEGANNIKNDPKIMCVIGNPPYLGEAGTPSNWMNGLLEIYRTEPEKDIRLEDEKQLKWINDLYVQFIRFASYIIEGNSEGIMAFITNHAFLDNITYRGMRWHLLKTFDKIWVLDLHGNTTRREKNPNGGPDENIFNIRTGVSIIIAVKKNNSDVDTAEVLHGEIWGTQQHKLDVLKQETIDSKLFHPIKIYKPNYILKHRSGDYIKYYEGFAVNELMTVRSVGILTGRDSIAIDFDPDSLSSRIQRFSSLETEVARKEFDLGKDGTWKIKLAQNEVKNFEKENVKKICYRPFDQRVTYYSEHKNKFIIRPQYEKMRHLLLEDNYGLILGRQGQVVGNMQWNLVFIQQGLVDLNIFYRGGGTIFPMFLDVPNIKTGENKLANFESNIYNKLKGIVERDPKFVMKEIDVLDYIYGILHCHEYRNAYADFLANDFPRIPWPSSPENFRDISEKGKKLRKLHLMQPDMIGELKSSLKGEGDNIVKRVHRVGSEVRINESQYFDSVSDVAWNFYVGGYQPAQKWLKDRKNMKLDIMDDKHYGSILNILDETDRIMKTIKLPQI